MRCMYRSQTRINVKKCVFSEISQFSALVFNQNLKRIKNIVCFESDLIFHILQHSIHFYLKILEEFIWKNKNKIVHNRKVF